MPVAIEDVVESAARGVLRALEAREEGVRANNRVLELVRSGFGVEISIRGGGRLSEIALTPQPLPPKEKLAGEE